MHTDSYKHRFSLDSLARSNQAQPRACDYPGCSEPGLYRAPKSRERLREYWHFCLEHVREYNKAWNYYAGLNDDEIEELVRQDTVWGRGTRPMSNSARREEELRARVWRDFATGADGGRAEDSWEDRRKQAQRKQSSEEDRALATLELEGPVDFAAIKAKYRELVKRHHPDANGGSQTAEETLKSINHAYGVLKAVYAA